MTRVVLVDDHALFRQSLGELLRARAGVEVVGEAGDGDAALEILERTSPDMVILDVNMPGRDGLAVSRAIREQGRPVRVLLLTMLSGPDMVCRARDAGAHGLLFKDNTFDELLAALDAVMNGKWYVSPALTGPGLEAGVKQPFTGLSAREEEILRGIAAGRTNRGMADELGISVKTVDTHRARIMRKLNAHSTADLVRYALNHGLE